MNHRILAGSVRLGVALIMFATSFAVTAQEQSPAPKPEIMLRDFYQWYVGEAIKNRDPLSGERKELKRYVSSRLIRELDAMVKGPDGLNGDYFLDAQDFDDDWAKNVTVSAPELKGDRGTATVQLKGAEMSRKLRVSLVQEKGAWKIDQVAGEEE